MTEPEPIQAPEQPVPGILPQKAAPPAQGTPLVIPEPLGNRMKLGDLVGLITVAITISAAVFYIAGWIYEVYWYGFFGINVTQISIPLQQIMIEGLPGILIIVVSLLISNLLFSIRRWNIQRRNTEGSAKNLDVLWTILLAYGLSVVTVLVIGLSNISYLYPVPLEIVVSGVGLLFVLIILFLLSFLRRNRIASLLIASKDIIPILFNIGLGSVILGRGIASPLFDKIINQLIKSRNYKEFGNNANGQAENLVVSLINAWRIWIGLVILFFVFLSLTTSAILGQVNAHQGQRLMIGGWKIRETYLVSSNPALPLPLSTNIKINNSNAFGPFGLVAYDAQAYYLAEWKSNGYYENRPNIYIVPRSSDPGLEVIFVPMPTPTPLPTTIATTMPTFTTTPSATITPTFTQIATSSP
jgi:hypothetical protein